MKINYLDNDLAVHLFPKEMYRQIINKLPQCNRIRNITILSKNTEMKEIGVYKNNYNILMIIQLQQKNQYISLGKRYTVPSVLTDGYGDETDLKNNRQRSIKEKDEKVH